MLVAPLQSSIRLYAHHRRRQAGQNMCPSLDMPWVRRPQLLCLRNCPQCTRQAFPAPTSPASHRPPQLTRKDHRCISTAFPPRHMPAQPPQAFVIRPLPSLEHIILLRPSHTVLRGPSTLQTTRPRRPNPLCRPLRLLQANANAPGHIPHKCRNQCPRRLLHRAFPSSIS